MPPQKPVSVIIPTRNQVTLLKSCLKALLNQKVYPQEIIVVDNNSTDNTHKISSSFSRKTPVIRSILEKRVGPSFSRNRGITEARGEIITFIDSDCLPPKDWVENIWKSHKDNKEVIVQGVWTNTLLDQSVPSNLYFFSLEVYRRLLFKNSSPFINFIDTKNFSLPKNLLVKKKLMFDPKLPLYAEDVDFGLQAVQKGIPIVCDSRIRVRHLISKNWLGVLKSSFGVGKAQKLLEKKWHLEGKRKRELGKSFYHHWKKQRNQFIFGRQKEIGNLILKKKGFSFQTLFRFGQKLGKLFRWFGKNLS